MGGVLETLGGEKLLQGQGVMAVGMKETFGRDRPGVKALITHVKKHLCLRALGLRERQMREPEVTVRGLGLSVEV